MTRKLEGMRGYLTLPLLCFLLTGCGTSRVGTEVVSQKITLPDGANRPSNFSWQQWTARTNEDIRKEVTLNARGQAFVAYRSSLAEQVDAGKMSPAQMDFLARKELAAVDAADRAEANSSAGTVCNSHRFGTNVVTNCY